MNNNASNAVTATNHHYHHQTAALTTTTTTATAMSEPSFAAGTTGGVCSIRVTPMTTVVPISPIHVLFPPTVAANTAAVAARDHREQTTNGDNSTCGLLLPHRVSFTSAEEEEKENTTTAATTSTTETFCRNESPSPSTVVFPTNDHHDRIQPRPPASFLAPQQKAVRFRTTPQKEEKKERNSAVVLNEEARRELWYQKEELASMKQEVKRILAENEQRQLLKRNTSNNRKKRKRNDDENENGNNDEMTGKGEEEEKKENDQFNDRDNDNEKNEENNGDNTEHCGGVLDDMDGLERYGDRRRSVWRKSAILYVLKAQKRARATIGYCDEEKNGGRFVMNEEGERYVRGISLRCTGWARQKAKERGTKDALEVAEADAATAIANSNNNSENQNPTNNNAAA